jgi:hypothetical protein
MLAEIIPTKVHIAPPCIHVPSPPVAHGVTWVQMHLPEFTGLDELNAKLPAAFPAGLDWTKVYVSPTNLLVIDLMIYARQGEAILSQWVRTRTSYTTSHITPSTT